MVAIFIWFGTQKFTPYAAHEISPLISNSPFIGWLGVFGERGQARFIRTIELITAVALIIGSASPIASALGAALASVTFILTTTFIFTTPGITMTSASGIPIVSTLVEMFLVKDVALLSACLTLLVASLQRPKPA